MVTQADIPTYKISNWVFFTSDRDGAFLQELIFFSVSTNLMCVDVL